ncbi:efflux transporter periplasmic adaptor subunit [Arcobacter suis]|uniref:RND family efflux system, membrane fusion protein n=1 Tax=Arcobacter suis CECT 7833 TaxID=663365 RepID=A0AAD0WPR6_9BACT|nr:efflux RND transporter periplasmic adaptor subunit [Arcobacter suis]AXX88994.1 RND family efflux system, membrane fusion protein [Arcobacter suis CECT 7833]RWS47997.1 efflux transporter periplasmic adaptor subunit [Arcobacter suis]
MDANLQNELKNYSNKNSKKKYFFIIFIILLLGSAVYYYFFISQAKKEDVVLYNTKKVTKGDLSVVVSATGTLNPTNSVEIGVEVSGTIKEIYVDFNDEVEVGQLLAILDTRKLQSEVDGQTASLGISKANLKESEVNLRNKKAVYDRTLKMYNSSGGKYPSINELDDAKFAYESSVSSLEASKAKVEQSSFSLNTAKQNLDKAYVKSSIKGIVLNRAVEVGQTLAASMNAPKLFTLAKDLTQMDLIVSIDESDVADIKKDLDVTFTVDAYPNKNFKGKIKQVRLNPVTVNGVVTYETVVGVNNEELLLRPGMTATAQINTKQSLDKLMIPNGALRFKPKVQSEQKANTMNLVQPPRRLPGENPSKDLGKKEFSPIFILENNQPKRVMVKVLETDGKITTVESNDLKVDDELIISQKSDNGK